MTASTASSTAPRDTPAWPLAGLVAALLAIKLAWLSADPTLRLFMGDSASYLHAALTGWVPYDRSFTYGWLLQASAVAFSSYRALLLMQAGCGVLASVLLYRLLAGRLGVGRGLAGAAVLLLALDPAQVFYERMVMAEATGTAALAAHVLAMATYAATSRRRWLVLAAACGLAAASLRFSLLPVLVGLAATVPWIAAAGERRWPRGRAFAMHLGLAFVLAAGAHVGYTRLYGRLAGVEPTWMPAAGQMRLGLVAPLVRPEHFAGTGVSADVLAEVRLPLADPGRRESHIWSEEGLYAALARHSDDPQAVARTLSARALGDAPLALFGLGYHNTLGYFDAATLAHRVDDDLGVRAPPAELLQVLHDRLGYDGSGVAGRETVATRWFRTGVPWLIGVLLALPLLATAALACSWKSPQRPAALVLWLASLGLVSSHLLFAHIPSLRYLHPLPWFALANLAVLAAAARRRFQGPGTAR